MSVSLNLRQEVLKKLDSLDNEQLTQVLHFLKTIEGSDLHETQDKLLNDPLEHFIGGVEYGNLTKNCDQDL